MADQRQCVGRQINRRPIQTAAYGFVVRWLPPFVFHYSQNVKSGTKSRSRHQILSLLATMSRDGHRKYIFSVGLTVNQITARISSRVGDPDYILRKPKGKLEYYIIPFNCLHNPGISRTLTQST